MVGIFKKNELPKKEVAKTEIKKTDVKKTVVKKVETPKAEAPKIVKRTGPAVSTVGADDKIKAFKDKKNAEKDVKQEEFMHSKTHQDLINAAYKAAEELKIAPFVLLRAAEWGHFTDDRGKRYDGPVIDEIKGLDDAQKKALKKALGL
jgi:hypothetical protein